MPQVPRYQKQVNEAGFPGVRVNTDAPLEAFGGGVSAQQATNANINYLKQVEDIQLKAKQRADDAVTQEAYAKAINFKNDYLYHPEKGALKRQGKDALSYAKEDQEAFDKEMNGISSSLTNPIQRDMFEKIKGRVGSDFNQTLTNHASQEAEKLEIKSAIAGQEATIQDIGFNAANPQKTAEGFSILKSQTRSDPRLRGQDQQTIDVESQKVTSKAYTIAISNLVDHGHIGRARELREEAANSKDITIQDLSQVDGLLKSGGVKQEAQNISDDLISKGKGESWALAQIRKIKDPDTREEARRKTKQHYSDIEEQTNKHARQRYDSAFDLADKSGDVDAIPQSMWDKLEARERATIEKFIGVRRMNNGVVPTDEGLKNKLLEDLANPATKLQAARENYNNYAAELSQRDLKYIQEQADGVLKDDEKTTKRLNSFLNNNLKARATLKEAGIDLTPGDEADAQDLGLFMKKFQEKVGQKSAGGKELSEDEVQEILDDMVIDVEEDGWFNANRKRYNVTPGLATLYDGVAIPDEIADSIIAGLRRRGLEVTPEAIAARYRSAKK